LVGYNRFGEKITSIEMIFAGMEISF
jgi:hypothetical protein